MPNRPTFATTGETVQRGVLEIEYGLEAADGHQDMNGLLKFGLFKNLERRLANNPFERDNGVAGLSDSGAGFKFKVFLQKDARPTLSILYTASLPTATAGLDTGATGHSVQLLLSKDFGKHHIDLNEGVQFVGRPGVGGYDRNYFSSFSYAHPIQGKWGWTGEVAGFSLTNASTPASMVVLGAVTYSPSPRLVLDGGAYVSVYGNLPRSGLRRFHLRHFRSVPSVRGAEVRGKLGEQASQARLPEALAMKSREAAAALRESSIRPYFDDGATAGCASGTTGLAK